MWPYFLVYVNFHKYLSKIVGESRPSLFINDSVLFFFVFFLSVFRQVFNLRFGECETYRLRKFLISSWIKAYKISYMEKLDLLNENWRFRHPVLKLTLSGQYKRRFILFIYLFYLRFVHDYYTSIRVVHPIPFKKPGHAADHVYEPIRSICIYIKLKNNALVGYTKATARN